MACHSTIVKAGDGDENRDAMEHMSEMFGPGHVDQAVRQAIQACWMILPKNRRNVDEVERHMRDIFERALKNLREDSQRFARTD